MTDPATGNARLRKALIYAKQYGLTRDDRMSLAQTLLWRDVTSWTQLSDEQLIRLLDALEGHALVSHLIRDRQP